VSEEKFENIAFIDLSLIETKLNLIYVETL